MRRQEVPADMPKKLAVVLLHLIMLALVCAIAAYWAIRIMTPPPATMPPLQPAAAPREAEPVLAARMFGLIQAAPAQVAMNVQALGAFAAGRDSAAVLAVDGKPARVYLLNQELTGGVKLVEVRKDAVAIEQGGVRREIALPTQQALSLGGPPPPAGFAREGDTLTAPTVAGSALPAASGPRPLPPRPAVPPPQVPTQPPQPMSIAPQTPVPQPPPPADEESAPVQGRRQGVRGPLAQ